MATTEAAILQNIYPAAALGSVTLGRRAGWWRRCGSKRRGFRYEWPDGRPVADEAALERIRALAVPPAWAEVRVSPSPRSRLQAIGIDTAGRVQRVYHPSFVARQRLRKYKKIERFGELLPALRRRTNEDIETDGLTKRKVLAVVVNLINELYFRVGSEHSVRRYRTYGVTTLRRRHLEIEGGGRLVFRFTGKHNIKHRRVLVDDGLTALMRDLKSLRGARLFKYYDEEGRVRAVRPRDVNEYIKEATAPEFSAKDFRTWGGSLLAAVKLAEAGRTEDETLVRRNVGRALKSVAEHLGNTPTVCRNSYVHPVVFDSYRRGLTIEEFRPRRERRIGRRQPEYLAEEAALLRLLRAASGAKD